MSFLLRNATALLLLLLWLGRGEVPAQGCDTGPPLEACAGEAGACTVYNSQGMWEDRSNCRAAAVAYPKTEAELLTAVAGAARKKQKIKLISPLAHSRPPLMCAGAGDGTGLLISTRHLSRYIHVDVAAATVTVDAGVNMRQLQDAVGAAGLAFPTSTSWEGVSAAGSISTGAHGSGLAGRGSNIHDYVVGVRIVVPASPAEGYAKVVQLGAHDPDLKAAALSLGVLGAIFRVTFALEPLFKRSVSLSLDDDTAPPLEDRLVSFLKATDFANIYWYVAQGKALMGRIARVPVNASGDGINQSSDQSTTVAKVRASDEKSDQIEKAQDSVRLCNNTRTSMNNRFNRGAGFLNTPTNFTGFPVVGFNHKMINAGGCEKYGVREHETACEADAITDSNQSVCSWDRRAGPRQTWDFEFRVPLRVAAEAMRDMKRIRDSSDSTRQALCSVEGSGIVMRSLPRSQAYLGPPEDAVTFEMSYYRSQQAWTPKWNMDVFTEMEQMLVEKYGAHLHWGKSGGYYMDAQAQQRTVNFSMFQEVRQRFDPDSLFLNDWSEKLLGIRGKRIEEIRDGCALENLCKCSLDSHCAPSQGYFCRPGRVYTAARVCRQESGESYSSPSQSWSSAPKKGGKESMVTIAVSLLTASSFAVVAALARR